MILAIETATNVCSVALFRDNGIIGLLESDEHNAHSRILHVLIDRLFNETGTSLSQLTAVAVSKGPGSYTGLRIGVSAAKGFCYAKDIPLIAINTLECMAAGMKMNLAGSGKTIENPLLIPMIDARRMEVYSAIYNTNLVPIRETQAEIITPESFSNLRLTSPLVIAGDGANKCKNILPEEKIIYLNDFQASAAWMLHPAIDAFRHQRFENTAYFEPFYLKDFIAGKPRVKGLE